MYKMLKIKDNSKEVLIAIDKGLIQGLLESSELLATNISKNTPVLTGNLRANTRPTRKVEQVNGGLKTRVENPVEYGIYIEYGTSRMRPRGMFRKGAVSSEATIPLIFKKNLPK